MTSRTPPMISHEATKVIIERMGYAPITGTVNFLKSK